MLFPQYKHCRVVENNGTIDLPTAASKYMYRKSMWYVFMIRTTKHWPFKKKKNYLVILRLNAVFLLCVLWFCIMFIIYYLNGTSHFNIIVFFKMFWSLEWIHTCSNTEYLRNNIVRTSFLSCLVKNYINSQLINLILLMFLCKVHVIVPGGYNIHHIYIKTHCVTLLSILLQNKPCRCTLNPNVLLSINWSSGILSAC